MRRFNDKVNLDAAKYPKACELEERILGILLLYPEHMPKAIEALPAEDFLTAFNRRVYESLTELYRSERFDPSYLNETYTPEEVGRINEMMQKRRMVSSNGEKTLFDAVSMLKAEKEKSVLSSPDTDFMAKINANKKKHGITEKKDG